LLACWVFAFGEGVDVGFFVPVVPFSTDVFRVRTVAAGVTTTPNPPSSSLPDDDDDDLPRDAESDE